MAIGKRDAARAAMIRGRQVVPALWAPLRDVQMGIGLEITIVDAVGMFIQKDKKLRRMTNTRARHELGVALEYIVGIAESSVWT